MGSARKNTDAIINPRRPNASDNMPINGDINATANTVAPTVVPAVTALMPKSRINTGNTD